MLVPIPLATLLLVYPLLGKEKLDETDGNAFIHFEHAEQTSVVLVPVYVLHTITGGA
jgi:hypothetical protein